MQSRNSMSPFVASRNSRSPAHSSGRYAGAGKSVGGGRPYARKKISANKVSQLMLQTENIHTENDGETCPSIQNEAIYAMSSMSSRYLKSRAKANLTYANRDLLPYQHTEELSSKFFAKGESKAENKNAPPHEFRKNHKSSGMVLQSQPFDDIYSHKFKSGLDNYQRPQKTAEGIRKSYLAPLNFNERIQSQHSFKRRDHPKMPQTLNRFSKVVFDAKKSKQNIL